MAQKNYKNEFERTKALESLELYKEIKRLQFSNCK